MDAGIPMGKAMRGARLADTVIVTGADGFTVAFALVELDRAFRADPATLCYERDGLPLDAKEGPLRLIVTDDLKKGRWVRQVKSLTVYRAPTCPRAWQPGLSLVRESAHETQGPVPHAHLPR